MTRSDTHISITRLRTPRMAAVAGIVFAVLQLTSLILIRSNTPATATDTGEWLATSLAQIQLAIRLIPFAGIAFLWYMGVIRDLLGHLEDQFFSTLFIGSGLLYLAMTFVGSAMAGGTLVAYDVNPSVMRDSGSYFFSRAVMFEINNVYAIRMAGMNTLVLGTIWIRTRVAPRWLSYSTLLLALVLLLSATIVPWAALIFPAWVGVLSSYILIRNLNSDSQAVQDGDMHKEGGDKD